MSEFPSLAGYPIYKEDVAEKRCLMDNLVPATVSSKPALRLDKVIPVSAKAGRARVWLPSILQASTP